VGYAPAWQLDVASSFAQDVAYFCSDLTGANVPAEVFAQPATEEDVIVASNASIFGSLGPTLAVFEGEQQWHRYAPDEWVGQWADTSPNILILQGSFDAVTPPRYARELSEQFAGRRGRIGA
jgi:hypothetical protein